MTGPIYRPLSIKSEVGIEKPNDSRFQLPHDLCIFFRTWSAPRPVRFFSRTALVLALTVAGLASASAQTFTLTLQPNTIPAVTQGVAYNQAITAVGGNSNYSLAITSGALPTGITLAGGAGTWALVGTSNAPGSYDFTITATDIDGNTGFRPYTLSIG